MLNVENLVLRHQGLMVGVSKMHSDQAGEAQNDSTHTFHILEVVQGQMQTWYPCFT